MSITKIDPNSVHRICSGQVISDLTSVVKELVENSLDAGATNIEVRFKEYGVGMIEVIDNGSGINEKDFTSVGLRYCTSKLSTFKDLEKVGTLGFRGEALSSLCAASNLVIVTSTSENTPLGTKLCFNTDGSLKSKEPVARQVGTTCQITELLKAYPVRHREFLRNSKKEVQRCLQLLYSYALFSGATRLRVQNIDGKGKPTQLLSFAGSSDILANFNQLFNVSNALEPFDFTFELSGNQKSKIKGLLSKFKPGSGRSSGDRQFASVNGRPCSLPKIFRVFNEIYKTQYPNQFPIVVIQLELSNGTFDINLTPDKRTIMLHNESEIITLLQDKLSQLHDSSKSALPLNLIPSPVISRDIKSHFIAKDSSISAVEGGDLLSPSTFKEPSPVDGSPKIALDRIDYDGKTKPFDTTSNFNGVIQMTTKEPNDSHLKTCFTNSEHEPDSKKPKYTQGANTLINQAIIEKSTSLEDSTPQNIPPPYASAPLLKDDQIAFEQSRRSAKLIDPIASLRMAILYPEETEPQQKEIIPYNPESYQVPTLEENYDVQLHPPMSSGLLMHWEWILTDTMFHQKHKKEKEEPISAQPNDASNFCNLNQKEAEIALTFQLEPKKDFCRMKVIGQFNLGFIVAKLDKQLFIIDQHAADEIYNYTKLHFSHSLVKRQPLAKPKALNLSISDELLAIDHLPYLQSQGYSFSEIPGSLPGQRLQLTSIPSSGSLTFDHKDFERLLYELSNNPRSSNGLSSKGSKLDMKLASMACRKSVMIGDSLDAPTMAKILVNLGTIPRPWNCPHGRPTLRHLSAL